jgi:hypothetical protein
VVAQQVFRGVAARDGGSHDVVKVLRPREKSIGDVRDDN